MHSKAAIALHPLHCLLDPSLILLLKDSKSLIEEAVFTKDTTVLDNKCGAYLWLLFLDDALDSVHTSGTSLVILHYHWNLLKNSRLELSFV